VGRVQLVQVLGGATRRGSAWAVIYEALGRPRHWRRSCAVRRKLEGSAKYARFALREKDGRRRPIPACGMPFLGARDGP
jgi:hypothetical protein